jgi:PAS domain S-box-containing protein
MTQPLHVPRQPPAVGLRIVFWLGLYCALSAVVSLLGWALDLPRLADWDADGIAIQPNAAVAAIAAGAGLLLVAAGRPRAAAAVGAGVCALGAALFLQHAAGVDLGIDRLLLFGRSWGELGTVSPGRVGLPGSAAWALIGAALVLQAGGAQARRAVPPLALGIVAIATFSLTGYLFGADRLHNLPRLTAIAMQTATMALAGGLALIAAVPERQPMRGLVGRSAASLLIRRALPFVVLLPFALGFLRLAGENAGLYDTATGVALFALALIGMLAAVLWWSAGAVYAHERRLARTAERSARADLVLREVREQFFLIDREGRVAFVNDAVCQTTGRTREEVLGRRFTDAFPSTNDALSSVARRVRTSGEPETVEYQHPATQRWFETRMYAAPQGGLAVFILEQTERKRAEAALRESEERYRTLVSIVTDVPWRTDATGAFAVPQLEWGAYTGQPFEAHRGLGWADAIHPEDRARVLFDFERARKEHATYESQARIWHAPTQAYRHIIGRATPLFDEEKNVREWVGTCTDVHEARSRELSITALAEEREALLERAERARAEAEAANHTKDEFLAVLSHELRSPLNAMLGWVQVLDRAGGTDPLVARSVETIERNIRAQAQIIDDLLDTTRITSGNLALERVRVELGAVVADTVESLRPMAAAKRLALALELPGARLEAMGDAARLGQVVRNVVHNAIKYTPEGGRVSVRLSERDGRAEIAVEDNGRGIEPERLPRVFDRFVQLEPSTTRRHGGLGLGLAIVKHLTELHGGAARAESEGLDRGARFTITLPLAPAGAAEVRAPAPRPPAVRRGEDLAGLDVLLVEDEADSREALGLAAARRGLRVRLAGSAREALDACAAQPPDVLVSDVAMPEMDGYTLIRTLRAREAATGGTRRTVAIAMTGFASRIDRELALRAGFDDHLGKPVEIDALLDRVRLLVT